MRKDFLKLDLGFVKGEKREHMVSGDLDSYYREETMTMVMNM